MIDKNTKLQIRRRKSESDNFKKHSNISAEFDSTFYAFSNNEKLLRKFLDEESIKDFINLNSAFERKNLLFSIIDNSCFIEISTFHNLFEIERGYDNPIANANAIKVLLKELDSIFKIIDRVKILFNKTNEYSHSYPEDSYFEKEKVVKEIAEEERWW